MNVLIYILSKIASRIFCSIDEAVGRKGSKEDYIMESAERYYRRTKRCPNYLSAKDCIRLKAKMASKQNEQDNE
jgi:hypothetical protein